MSATKIFMGLDCGGSSSRAIVMDEGGEILFQGHSGAANLASTPEHRLKRNLIHAIKGAPLPTHVCGCFAGLINEEIRERGISHLKAIFPEAVVRAEPDYTAALYAAPEGTDIVVIAGTGSLVCSRSKDGIAKSGGRGYILGDHGSAYQYGRDALVHFLEHPDQRSENLRLAVLETFGTLEESPIVASVYKAPTPATILGKLARALGQDARAGEGYAVESLRRNATRLAQFVQGHRDRYLDGRKGLSVCLAGGVWKAAPIFREAFGQILIETLSDETLNVQRIARPPLHGAVELAKEMIHGN